MKHILNILSGIIYPSRCALCDRPLKRNEKYICKKCSGSVEFIKGRTCAKCGRVMKSRFEELCGACLRDTHEFDAALAPFSYSGKIRDSLIKFKYFGRAENSSFYAKCILHFGSKKIKGWNASMLIPVPVHYSRYAKRGYNQAELIAEQLSRLTGIPTGKNVIIRRKKTEAQKELGVRQRRENLEDAFSYVYDGSLPERVVIVDDILTTGSTVDAVSHILRLNGARYIYVVCVGVP